jgi:hypothetical protein
MNLALRAWVRRTDFGGGLLCIAAGALALYLLGGIRMGSLAAMGAGFLPVWLARVLIVLGVLIVLRSLLVMTTVNASRAMLRPLIAVIGAVVFFALALQYFGFLITSAVTLAIASLATRDFRSRETIVIAVIGAAAATLLFVYLLRLNIPVWPAWTV